jgi:hypothetical protein
MLITLVIYCVPAETSERRRHRHHEVPLESICYQKTRGQEIQAQASALKKLVELNRHQLGQNRAGISIVDNKVDSIMGANAATAVLEPKQALIVKICQFNPVP